MTKGKRKEDKEFFVCCPKCSSKIFTHEGYMEHPKEFFTFAVTCPFCGKQFNHKTASEKAHMKMQFDQVAGMINPDTVKKLAKKMLGADDEG